jgi:hypothetical protein
LWLLLDGDPIGLVSEHAIMDAERPKSQMISVMWLMPVQQWLRSRRMGGGVDSGNAGRSELSHTAKVQIRPIRWTRGAQDDAHLKLPSLRTVSGPPELGFEIPGHPIRGAFTGMVFVRGSQAAPQRAPFNPDSSNIKSLAHTRTRLPAHGAYEGARRGSEEDADIRFSYVLQKFQFHVG